MWSFGVGAGHTGRQKMPVLVTAVQRATLYQCLDSLRHVERLSTRFTKQPAREAGDLRRLAHAERARKRIVSAFDT